MYDDDGSIKKRNLQNSCQVFLSLNNYAKKLPQKVPLSFWLKYELSK